jgi:NAD-dependent deacetylase
MVEHAGIERVGRWLAAARSICVLTGAGMSAESGIPTFRDAEQSAPTAVPRGEFPALGRPGGGTGLWSRFDPAQLASEEGFRADPGLVWDWYAERREGVRRTEPNAGHVALARFMRRHPGRMTIVTQNVDDLHQRAGSEGVIRLHGDILGERWLDACPRAMACDTAWAAPCRPPRCAECGNLVRPDVVWFGELLPLAAIDAAERAAKSCALLLVVGTSGVVHPAAGLAHAARRAGAQVAILNPHPSDLDDIAHERLRGTAASLLPALLDGV